MQEIKIYKAVDGTIFDTREECKKYEYENDFETKIKEDFKKLILNKREICQLTKWGDVPLMEVGECYYVAIIEIKDKKDLETAQVFQKFVTKNHPICADNLTEKYIGKQILVCIGNDYDWCYAYGTIDECVEKYKDALMQVYEKEDD